jgi:hypothetical protein
MRVQYMLNDLSVSAEPVRNLVHICGPGRLPKYVYAFWRVLTSTHYLTIC